MDDNKNNHTAETEVGLRLMGQPSRRWNAVSYWAEELLGAFLGCRCSIWNTRRNYFLISGQCGQLPCMQHLSMTAFTCSLRREGCLMDKNRQVIWEMSYDVPTVLALMAFICLWGFVASAATIYSSTLSQWI
jgi:hypothetical protein